YGQPKIAKLVAGFANGGADAAFMSAFGVDTAAFGTAWLRSIGAPAPKVFGPQPAPPGPLPSDWLGPPPLTRLPAASPSSAPSAPSAAVPAPASGAGQGTGGSAVALVLLAATALLVVVA